MDEKKLEELKERYNNLLNLILKNKKLNDAEKLHVLGNEILMAEHYLKCFEFEKIMADFMTDIIYDKKDFTHPETKRSGKNISEDFEKLKIFGKS